MKTAFVILPLKPGAFEGEHAAADLAMTLDSRLGTLSTGATVYSSISDMAGDLHDAGNGSKPLLTTFGLAHPFHVAAILLGLDADALSRLLDHGAPTREGSPAAASDPVRKALALYEAEITAINERIDPVAKEAERIGGGTATTYLSELVTTAIEKAREGSPLNALDLAALDEALSRVEENGEDDTGDYYGPGAVTRARDAGYTVSEVSPGCWVFFHPTEGGGDEAPHDSEAEAWDAAAADHACNGEA